MLRCLLVLASRNQLGRQQIMDVGSKRISVLRKPQLFNRLGRATERRKKEFGEITVRLRTVRIERDGVTKAFFRNYPIARRAQTPSRVQRAPEAAADPTESPSPRC